MSAINPGSMVFVTGANGLIGSHVVDQLAARGFKVRAGVRDAQKSAWLPGLIAELHPSAPALELVEIPDLAKTGALDEALKGVEGIALVASDLSFSPDAKTVIQNSVDSALAPLRAATKFSSVKRVVVTSSNVASYFSATMQEEVKVSSESWADWALQAAQAPDLPQTPQTSFLAYCASKVASEKATWEFVKTEKPAFNVATVLPHQTTGQILAPKSQGGSSAAFFRGLFQGEMGMLEMLPACNYVDVQDVAKLHVAALVDADVKNERLFAVGGTKSVNQILSCFRSHFPEKTFLDDFAAGTAGSQVDRSTIVEAGRAEEVLKRINGGVGWKGLEDSIIENVADLA